MTNPLLNALPKAITSSRISLQMMDEQQAEDLWQAAIESYEGLSKWYGGGLVKKDLTLDQVKIYIQSCLADFYKREFIQYLVYNQEEKLVGIAALHHLDWSVPKGRIGYWVRKSEEGKGYATEIGAVLSHFAFEKLKLLRLEIRTATDNKASSSVPKKLGYEYVATFLKNKIGNNGDIWDLEIFVRYNLDNLNLEPIDYKY